MQNSTVYLLGTFILSTSVKECVDMVNSKFRIMATLRGEAGGVIIMVVNKNFSCTDDILFLKLGNGHSGS